MHHMNRRTLPSHVPRPGPSRRPHAPSPARAPRGDAGALLPLDARRAALLGVLHRPHPEPEHATRLPRGRPPLRRMVRAPGPRPWPGRAGSGRGLRRGADADAIARDRQAAPRGAADALRLARRRPGPPLQPASSVRGPKHVVKSGKTPSSPRKRPGPSSTASTSRAWWASATARSSASSSTASRG